VPATLVRAWVPALLLFCPQSIMRKLVLAAVLVVVPAVRADIVYFTESGHGFFSPVQVSRVNYDGTNRQVVVPNLIDARSVALDAAGNRMFVTDHRFPTDSVVLGADLNGNNLQTLVGPLGTEGVWQIALDLAASKMYWAETQTGTGLALDRVRRANLDGSNVETLITGLTAPWVDPQGIALHAAANTLYIADGSGGTIYRANLDGSGLQQIASGLQAPRSLAIDLINSKLYTAEEEGNRVQRMNLDGTGVETVLSGLNLPRGVAVDPFSNLLFWSESSPFMTVGPNRIMRSNLDGTGIFQVAEANVPYGIAVLPTAAVPEPSSFVLAGVATLTLGLVRFSRKRKGKTRV
jgi:DNA-binding beta-propeller fold protein YncE